MESPRNISRALIDEVMKVMMMKMLKVANTETKCEALEKKPLEVLIKTQNSKS